MYVDDLLDSTETVETAQHLQNQLSDVLAMAGFNLQKWSSNEAAVIENVPVSDCLPTIDINMGEPPKTKTLGVMWEAARDVFLFQVKQPECHSHQAKCPKCNCSIVRPISILGTICDQSQNSYVRNLDGGVRLG